MLKPTNLFLVLISALVVGCSENTDSTLSLAANGSSEMQFSAPPLLINSRMISQEALFADVTIAYDDVSNSVTAQRQATTDVWVTELQVPTQTPFSITITWYDLVDQQRLDLVTSTRNFGPIEFSGELSITRDFSDFDSDGFDADFDSIANLTERLNGTSPFAPNAPDDPTTTPVPGTTTNPVVDGYEFVNSANGAVSEISDTTDTQSVNIIQTVPVASSSVPSSVDTPITLFFDDKLLLDSLFGNIRVLENNLQIQGTVTISESSNGFAILTFSPGRPYQDGATVSLQFTGGANGVQDDGGNPLIGNIGNNFELSINTISQNTESFDNNFSFESESQGVVFTGDGAILNNSLGCVAPNAGNSFAAISTGNSLVSSGSAIDGTSSTIQIGPINLSAGASNISFDFNFISEEFPSFIGSDFDDSSVISISGPSNTFSAVLTTVNTIGTDGFSVCSGVPGLSNSAGETGWQNRTINIANLGSPIVITFTVTDVADSGFSSILAVDNFSF
ncbi:MAG: hypothetical protein AB8B79_16770 [Granulosicoccus sp.]